MYVTQSSYPDDDDLNKKIRRIRKQLATFYFCTGTAFIGGAALLTAIVLYRTVKQ
jgi:hypothetical protein